MRTKLKALLTTGGRGTRLRPLTHTKNKHLIPIANKPIIYYALDYLSEAGITEVGIITKGEGLEMIEALGSGDKWGLNLTYIPQDEPKGLAHVVKVSQDFIGDSPFIFYLGDNILVGGIEKFIDDFEKSKSNCHLVLSKVNDPQRFGVPELKDNKIIGVVEKPENPKSDFAVTGIYLYDSSIFEAVNNIKPSDRGEYEISDAHQYLLDNGKVISYSEITGWWKDTGKPEDLLEANRLVLEKITNVHNYGDVSSDSELVGNVSVGKNTKIINSRIRGPVIIGEGCTIENSFIGPYTSIHDDTTIYDSAVEFSIILRKCLIHGMEQRMDGSIIGEEVEIVRRTERPLTNRFMMADHSRMEIVS